MRPGWNSTRRNRNIGTAKRGRGQDNRLVIPQAWPDDRVFWEVLRDPVAIPRVIGECEMTFLVEPALDGFTHACTVEDVARILSLVPQEHLDGIALFIWRQPTRKQAALDTAWGRMVYYADMGRYAGTAIYLEAQELGRPIRWRRSMTPDREAELDRLRQDGHRVDEDRRRFLITPGLESARATQLYRTVLHEVGHYVDWLTSVLEPSLRTCDDEEDERISRAYNTKTTRDKEAFAHRYADGLGERLRARAAIPFPRRFDPDHSAALGLDPSWFLPASG